MINILNNKSNITNLAIFTIFAGGALTFANNAPVQNVVIGALGSEVKKVISVDNTYIVNKDFSNYTPTISVQTVEENVDNYFVTYLLNTIDIDNFTWKDVTKTKTLTINKESLSEYKNLASFVQYELKQVINSEIDRLVRTQEVQKKVVSQKTTVTDYTGILGLVMDSKTVVDDPYKPEASTELLVPVPEKLVAAPDPIINLENLNNPTPVQNPVLPIETVATTTETVADATISPTVATPTESTVTPPESVSTTTEPAPVPEPTPIPTLEPVAPTTPVETPATTSTQ
jgi:hypothetical protein